MPVERAGSVCSDEGPSSPESFTSGESSPVASPASLSDHFADQTLYSPYEYASSSAAGSPSYPESPSFQFPATTGYDDSVDHFGCQAEFVEAVRQGNTKELKRVLCQYSQLVQINGILSPDGQTALTQSCLDGNLENIKVLMSHGASLHLANRDGFLPLHIAYWCGKVDIIKYMLNYVASRR